MSHPLITSRTREPIKRTARRIDRSYGATLRLARQGKLAAVQDLTGRWWSSKAAAFEFNNTPRPRRRHSLNWPKLAAEALKTRGAR